jgi:hypothetical protein
LNIFFEVLRLVGIKHGTGIGTGIMIGTGVGALYIAIGVGIINGTGHGIIIFFGSQFSSV